MKLEKIEGSENYAVTVVKLPPKQAVPGLDKLVKVTVFGNDVLVGKDTSQEGLYLFFPAECAINSGYLAANNEFRHSNLNGDQSKTGFFEDSGRVKAIKFKGVTSTGYLAPVNSLDGQLNDWRLLKEGMEFNICDGYILCKKYKIIRTQATTTKDSRFNKKLKRFSKLVPNQFRFHETTSQLAKNLHQFTPQDIIVITDKWHGTSAVFSNVLIRKKLTLLDKLAKWIFGVHVVDKYYDTIYSSRSVVKNEFINTDIKTNSLGGYYNEDIWGVVNKELVGKIEQGISIYGEIVGYLESGKEIQKGYDYGCEKGLVGDATFDATGVDTPEHKFVVYRMTYTKPDGSLIELSWQQIKDYCKKYNLETVKELYFGLAFNAQRFCGDDHLFVNAEDFQQHFFPALQSYYLEKDCVHCKNKVPAEGICVRIDGRETYMTYKLKSKRFLERETKELDKGEVNIEEDQNVEQDA